MNGRFTVRVYEDVTGGSMHTFTHAVGVTVADVAATHLPGRRFVAMLNGAEVGHDRFPSEGDTVTLAPRPLGAASVALGALAAVTGLASGFLARRARLSPAGDSASPPVDRPQFGRYSSEAFDGDTIPVVLGSKARHGGKIIAVVPGEGVNGEGDNRLRVLVCLSHGPIGRLGNQTADFDSVAWDQLSGIYLDDQPVSAFPGCRASGRLGGAGPEVLRGFDDTEVVREVGVGGATLRNTSGAERSGASASGEAFTFTTLGAVDYLLVRVRLSNGLYAQSPAGQLEVASVTYRVRTRAHDAGGGSPGAWDDWRAFTPRQAVQSSFYSTPRVVPAVTDRALDVQVERVSAEDAGGLVVNEIVWDQLVECADSDNTYEGYAVLALDLIASEQLKGVPRVSADCLGVACRVYDPLSPVDDPEFIVAATDNPAALALELASNAVWGMGAQTGRLAPVLPDFAEAMRYCDEIVTTPAGTEKRFRAGLVLDQARDGLDWLHAVCAIFRAVPVFSGDALRLAVDRPLQPVERITDGSITVADGVAEIELSRELGTLGYLRPNRVLGQFTDQSGEAQSVAFPEHGALWLADEPVHEKTVSLEGVFSPWQAARAVKYEAKRERFITGAVRVSSRHPVMVVQPGDRFDVATSLAAYGLASGNLRPGCTTTGLVLDRTVSLQSGVAYHARVVFKDGTVVDRPVSSPPGDYTAGAVVALGAGLPAAPSGDGEEYTLGELETIMKPYRCTEVDADLAGLRWTVSGEEYDDDLYDDSVDSVEFPPYSGLPRLLQPPGPVVALAAFERTVTRDGQARREVVLSWRQEPVDAPITAGFRVYRRVVGTSEWVVTPSASVATRQAVVDVFDPDRAYDFAVVAVSQSGAALSPYDPRVPYVTLVFGLSLAPPEPPDNTDAEQDVGNRYRLFWDAREGAVGYQVLAFGAASARPHAGAEHCLVVARTSATELYVELPPAQSCTFYVRSVAPSGRLSWTASVVTVASPAAPPGESVADTEVFTLAAGTLTNLDNDGGTLVLDDPAAAGRYESGEVDLGSAALSELTLRPTTENRADDPTLASNPFRAPSIEADQWGVVSVGPPVVGMLMPPYPDDAHSWAFSVRTHDGVAWGDWETLAPGASLSRVFRKYAVRVDLSRRFAPYRPALAGLVGVVTR